MILGLVFVAFAFAIPPMLIWTVAYCLFPRSRKWRLSLAIGAIVAAFALFPGLLIIYVIFGVSIFSLGILFLFEWLLSRDANPA